MSFEFVPQKPANALEFKRFIYNNLIEIKDKEPAEILFIEIDCYKDKYIQFIELILSFSNAGFDNSLMSFFLMGKPKSNYKIKFQHDHKTSYDFLRSLLIADGLMAETNYNAIINNVDDLKNYLQSKKIILNGESLRKGNMIVESIN